MTTTTAPVTYHDFRAAVDALPDEMRRTAETSWHKAGAYVWGRQDEQGGVTDSAESWAFGLVYGLAAADYYGERRGFLPNLRSAYDAWKRGEQF